LFFVLLLLLFPGCEEDSPTSGRFLEVAATFDGCIADFAFSFGATEDETSACLELANSFPTCFGGAIADIVEVEVVFVGVPRDEA
jgi:hypothetical protein